MRIDCILQSKEPAAYGSLTEEQFSEEIEKGMKDIKYGRVFSEDEVEAEIKLWVFLNSMKMWVCGFIKGI